MCSFIRYFNGMCNLLFDVFNECSSWIKEINTLIWKWMSNIYYREKLTFSNSIFSERKFEEMHNFEEQKGTRYIWENVYAGIIVFDCLSSTKHSLRFLLNCFVREIKGFYQSYFRNEGDFRDIMNVSLNILAKN